MSEHKNGLCSCIGKQREVFGWLRQRSALEALEAARDLRSGWLAESAGAAEAALTCSSSRHPAFVPPLGLFAEQ